MHLSSHEKAKLENEKQIYCLLRLINYVEKFYSTDKIDQLTYQNEINKLLDKYHKFSQITPNFNLQDFEKRHAIPHEEISWAKYVIEKGVEVPLPLPRDSRARTPSSTCRPPPPSSRSTRPSTCPPKTLSSDKSGRHSKNYTSSSRKSTRSWAPTSPPSSTPFAGCTHLYMQHGEHHQQPGGQPEPHRKRIPGNQAQCRKHVQDDGGHYAKLIVGLINAEVFELSHIYGLNSRNLSVTGSHEFEVVFETVASFPKANPRRSCLSSSPGFCEVGEAGDVEPFPIFKAD